MAAQNVIVTVEYKDPEAEKAGIEAKLQQSIGPIVGKPSIFDKTYFYTVKCTQMQQSSSSHLTNLLNTLKEDTENRVQGIEFESQVSAT
jgi:hypothetical protein